MAICPLCDEYEIPKGSRLPTCVNCRAHKYRWSRRSAAEILAWRRRLHISETRIDMIAVDPKYREALPMRPEPFLTNSQLKRQKKLRPWSNAHAR